MADSKTEVKVDGEGEGPASERPAEGAGAAVKARSETPYPYYGLSHAIEMVQAVRRAGGKEAPSAAVMKELNIAKNTDRLWGYGVPSATQYGLIERIGRGDAGRIKVTDLALRVTNPVSAEAGRNAKIAAAKTPELYAKLLEQFAGHPQPSREGLKNLLYTDHGIVESMALMAADAFLDTLKTADLLTANGEVSLGGAPPSAPKDKAPDATSESVSGMQVVHVPADFVIYKCKIGKGRVIDIPLPPNFTKAEAGKLYAFLQTQVDDDDAASQNGAL